ncbi:MAG: DUF4258 domain-containing protein [Planctomycetota bacterium]|nr:DUF4258 domain-containing protein [Planctomycetota bacterium]
MKYELTRHARNAMTERRIPIEWLERVLHAPEKTEPDKTDSQLVHHLARIPEHENRVLRVVLNPLVAPVRVVSAFFDRRMKGTL